MGIHIHWLKEVIMKFSQLLQRLFGSTKQKDSHPEAQGNQSEMMQKVMGMLAMTEEIELSCDEVLAVLDQAVELATRGEDISQLMPLVKRHLDMCPDCMEEYRALEKIVLNVV
jgi:hypothetical protein